MQYSGILVLFPAEAFRDGIGGLEALDGIEVHHREPETGRAIVVAETDDVEGQEAVLRRIRAVPGVVVAEPVYFYDDAVPQEERP